MKSGLLLFLTLLASLGSFGQTVNQAKLQNAKPVGGTIMRSIAGGDTSLFINQGAPGIVEIPKLDAVSKLNKDNIPADADADQYFDDGKAGTYNAKAYLDRGVLTGLVDPYTGERVSYKKLTGGSYAIDGVVIRKKGNDFYQRVYTGSINVDWFGAKGDGVTDDTQSIQKAFDFIGSYNSIAFTSGKTYKVSRVILTRTYIDLIGNGCQFVGTMQIGDATARTYNSHISGFTFSSTGNAIELCKTRSVFVINNIFVGNDKSVYVMPSNNGQAQHVNALIQVNDNKFQNVNYCFYVDITPGATWLTTSDCTFSGNDANSALVTGVFCAGGIDGLKFINNTMFMSVVANKKSHLIIMGQSDWVVVSNNQFFESGESSIYVVNCKALTIIGNNFAWTGQKGIFNVIQLAGTATDILVNVTGNIFDGFSGNVVDCISTTYGRINVTGNEIFYSDTFTNYTGSTDLATITHYIVNATSQFSQVKEDNEYNFANNLRAIKLYNTVTRMSKKITGVSESSAQRFFATNGSSPVGVLSLYDANGVGSNTYAGELFLTIKFGNTSTANTAGYRLNIVKASAITPVYLLETSRQGLVNGLEAGHPSFMFSVENDKLFVTPIGNTAGSFYLYGKSSGNLIIGENL